MADINPSAANNSANQVSSTNQASEAKKPLFWGSQEVFDNLEKFERISNPTDDNFDFDFSDITSEQNSSEQNSEEKKDEWETYDVSLDTPSDAAQDLSNVNYDAAWDFDFSSVGNDEQETVAPDAAETTVDLDMPAEEPKEEDTKEE